MIIAADFTKRWLKDNARSCGFGYQCDVSVFDNDDAIKFAVWYTTKYLSKSLEITQWPKHFRRIRTSRNWPVLPDDSDFERPILDWHYLCTYYAEGLDYLAYEESIEHDMRVKILS